MVTRYDVVSFHNGVGKVKRRSMLESGSPQARGSAEFEAAAFLLRVDQPLWLVLRARDITMLLLL